MDSASSAAEAAGAPEGPHDAAQGFHDIKPLPGFSPLPEPVLWGGAGFVAALLLAWLVWRIRRRLPGAGSAAPIDPEKAALDELEQLEQLAAGARVSVRELGARLSFLLRQYLEQRLQFPAVEQTSGEVARALPALLKDRFANLPQDRISARVATIRSMLRKCDQMAFDERPEAAFSLQSDQTSSLLADARATVTEISDWNRREEERRRSIVAQSQLASRSETAK